MQTEEEDAAASPPDSQTSSVEGVFPSDTGSSSLSGAKVSHPFRIIEHDALSLQSLTSLGRVGRLLAGLPDSAAARADIAAASSTSTLGGDLKEEEEDEDSPVTAHSSTASTTPSAATPLAPAPPAPAPAAAPATSTPLPNAPPAPEPDVIASTKGPVAPPRRKRKPKAQSTTNLAVS